MTTLTALALVVLVFAAMYDVRTRTIPNAISLGGALVGLIWHIHVAAAVDGLLAGALAGAIALASGVLCSLVPYWSFRERTLGGGDVKLFFAIGIIAGPWAGGLTYVATYMLLIGVVLGRRLLLLMRHQNALAVRAGTPLAPFIAAGYVVVTFIPSQL